MSQVEGNKQRVRVFFDAMNRADSEAIASAYAADGQLCTMGHTLISGTYDVAQIREFSGAVLESFPQGLSFEILNMTAEDERVAVEAVSSGQHVSGQDYRNHYHFLFTFRDGELLQLKEYMDTELATAVICGGQRPGG